LGWTESSLKRTQNRNWEIINRIKEGKTTTKYTQVLGTRNKSKRHSLVGWKIVSRKGETGIAAPLTHTQRTHTPFQSSGRIKLQGD
jgi:hypothetical protein